jgi:hypothetical protein
MSPRQRHLLSVVFLAVVLGAAVFAPSPVALRVGLALPLLLFLPGYALVWALFARATLDRASMLLLSIALSLAVVIIGSVALQWAGPLERSTWVALATGVTVVAGSVAVLRAGPSSDAPRLRLPRVRFVPALLLTLAVIVAAAAIALARTPLPARGVQGYTVLWVLPAKDGSHRVNVGVISSELHTTSYRLDIEENGRKAAMRQLTLAPTESWDELIRVPPSITRVRVLLHRESAPNEVYRRVKVLLPREERRIFYWSLRRLSQQLDRVRIRVEGMVIRFDASTLACTGIGRGRSSGGVGRWSEFACTQPTFPPGVLVGPDLVFQVRPLGPRSFRVADARLAR